MNDLERMKALFDSLGLKYCVKECDKTYGCNNDVYYTDTLLHLDQGVGYSGFFTQFYFKDGVFVTHGVWE